MAAARAICSHAVLKEKKIVKDQCVQCELFEKDRYEYRIFCTDLRCLAYKVITEYDKRADVEL
jgi:hypothetical protein